MQFECKTLMSALIKKVFFYAQVNSKGVQKKRGHASVHVASRVQTWAEECVHLHEVLKIEMSIFSTSCTVMHIRPSTFELCSYRSCMPSLLLYALVNSLLFFSNCLSNRLLFPYYSST